METLLASGSVVPEHAYLDGGMNPVFRKLLDRNGEQALAKKTSMTSVPISRPRAAAADPHQEGE
jgi:hypothetical protein